MATDVHSVKLGTKRLSAAALVAKGRIHVSCLRHNPAFPDPTPPLDGIETACDVLDLAYQAYAFNRGRRELQARNAAYRKLNDKLRELAAYITSKCGGRRDLILSAGYEVRGKRGPSRPMTAPQNLRSRFTREPGRLYLRWNAVKWRSIYEVFSVKRGPDGVEKLVVLQSTTKNFINLLGQTPGIHVFRVKAYGPAGEGPLSDACSVKVL